MPNQEIPDIPEEDFEAPEGTVEPEHPQFVPVPEDGDTQDEEVSDDSDG